MIGAGVSEWQTLVFPFRSLRESLTSHQSEDYTLTIAVFELAADVCLWAGDHSEFLKSCQQLMGSLYPAVRQETAVSATCAKDDARCSQRAAVGEGIGARDHPLLGRQAEMAGLWLLYFVCVPAVPEVRLQNDGVQNRGRSAGSEGMIMSIYYQELVILKVDIVYIVTAAIQNVGEHACIQSNSRPRHR